MPTVNPCVQCKEKHVKCDENRPKCARCANKGIDCTRPSKVTIFRHDAMSTFSSDQKWVKSQARKFQFDHHTQQDMGFGLSSSSMPSPSLDTTDGSSPRFMSEDASPGADDRHPSQSTVSSPARSYRTCSIGTSKRRRSETVATPVATPVSDVKMDFGDSLPSPSQLQVQLQQQQQQHLHHHLGHGQQQQQQPLSIIAQGVPETQQHGMAWPQPNEAHSYVQTAAPVPTVEEHQHLHHQQQQQQTLFPMYQAVPQNAVESASDDSAQSLAPTWPMDDVSNASEVPGISEVQHEASHVVQPVDPKTGWRGSRGEHRHDSHDSGSGHEEEEDGVGPIPVGSRDNTQTGEPWVDPPPPKFPLEDMQEACLMRYYIEVIAHWLDLADPRQHFERVVPLLARRYAHVLSAILAVSARHIIRMPQYRTERGLEYHGQLLNNLNRNSAIEYMLKSIPALWHLEGRGIDYLEGVVATAVLLRQLEEIDDADDGIALPPPPSKKKPKIDWYFDPGTGVKNLDNLTEMINKINASNGKGPGFVPPLPETNCLRIIDAMLRSKDSRVYMAESDMMQAAYWTALRQEICHAFTSQEEPQMGLEIGDWKSVSGVNRAVMHTVEVVKWRWGNSNKHTIPYWNKLMKKQEELEETVIAELRPIYRRDADRSKNEVFPVIWYSSNIEVTTMQQALMARAVLIAENPVLKEPLCRTTWRRTEAEVRRVLKELCGVGLCNPHSPPALLHTVLLIRAYGDYFTEPHERLAIKRMVERYRDTRAWPAKTLLGTFKA